MRAPTVASDFDMGEPVAGIPGIDNNKPKEEAAAVPNYLSGNAGLGGGSAAAGEVRVSLTGEVLEVAQPSRPASASAGMPQPVRSPGGGAAPVRSSYSRPAFVQEPAKSGGSPAVLLLGGGGAAGWFFWQKSHGPAVPVERLFTALKNKDWKTMYKDVPDSQKSMVPEDKFADLMNMVTSQATLKEFKVGDANVTGDKGTVSVTITADRAGKSVTQTQQIPVEKVGGEWKIASGQGGGGMGALMK